MSAATQNEMERLRRERDDAFAKGRQVFDDLRRVEAERNALAAHVERLRAALKYSSEYLYGSHLNVIGHGSKAHMEMVSALEDTPTTSLARRDLIKQAEALEDIDGYISIRQASARIVIRAMARKLRQQAEGGER